MQAAVGIALGIAVYAGVGLSVDGGCADVQLTNTHSAAMANDTRWDTYCLTLHLQPMERYCSAMIPCESQPGHSW